MPSSSFERLYLAADFVALVGGLSDAKMPQIESQIRAVAQSVPVSRVALAGDLGVNVTWAGYPSTGDLQQMDAAVAGMNAGETTSNPFEIESLGITSATDGNLVTKIDATTPPLDKGTYQALWVALVGMLATVANTGARGVITLTRIRGAQTVVRQWEHNWTMQQPQTFSGAITFQCESGDRIRALLQVAKVGAAAATAQMATARVTVDQIAAG